MRSTGLDRQTGPCARGESSEGVITGTKRAITVVEIRRRRGAAGRRPWGWAAGGGALHMLSEGCRLNEVEAACEDEGKGVPG